MNLSFLHCTNTNRNLIVLDLLKFTVERRANSDFLISRDGIYSICSCRDHYM